MSFLKLSMVNRPLSLEPLALLGSDVLYGVGLIAIAAAKIVKRVYANDLNPCAIEYLERNSVLNKLERKIEMQKCHRIDELVLEFYTILYSIMYMDRRQLAASFSLIGDFELEMLCMCFMLVVISYVYATWPYEHMPIMDRVFARNGTRTLFIDSLLGGEIHVISQLRMDRKTNCLGALDGIYIKVHVLDIDKARYRTRKGEIATNVLGVCNRDLEFIFVFPSWEGSAPDSRVLRDIINRPYGLKVSNGCYYLVNAGYTNDERFFTSYKGTRYHLSEWREGYATMNYQEYFNMKEMLFDPVEEEYNTQPTVNEIDDEYVGSVASLDECCIWRDNLAKQMFDEWRGTYVDLDEMPLANVWRLIAMKHGQLICRKDRATGIGAQTSTDIAEDLNIDIEQDEDTILGNTNINSPMSVNQPITYEIALPIQSSGRKRKNMAKDDLAEGLSEVASMFKHLVEKFEKNNINYPKFLAEELDRLGFFVMDNLKISKAIRNDPLNVEVFKVIKNDDNKIACARTFLEG
ncbi:hypothetical protein FNV43_RR17629 [Rhamnella rubrinervis]|uniref:DDE Tnp4 domain-containing protein n=1 Tax=Rhamnella rubrinervis TaxID=2594499 RepID=A0A8K0DXG8_9ROSA|nr:hypothetical protein FNV43_RR17629 [Rhamnella rubrinervis]